jgi:predicted TIM-barrel enzyme
MADANELVIAWVNAALPQVRHTPVIAGLNGVTSCETCRYFWRLLAYRILWGPQFPTVAWFSGLRL